MKGRRSDDNQGAVVTALRSIGCSVFILSEVGRGCPDLLIGFRGHNHLLEIKNPDGGDTLTPAQVLWHATWRGRVDVVRGVRDALALFGVQWTR